MIHWSLSKWKIVGVGVLLPLLLAPRRHAHERRLGTEVFRRRARRDVAQLPSSKRRGKAPLEELSDSLPLALNLPTSPRRTKSPARLFARRVTSRTRAASHIPLPPHLYHKTRRFVPPPPCPLRPRRVRPRNPRPRLTQSRGRFASRPPQPASRPQPRPRPSRPLPPPQISPGQSTSLSSSSSLVPHRN